MPRSPATADGFKRSVEFQRDVRVQQGENWLRSGRVEVQLAEKGREPERFTAERDVRFKVGRPRATATCSCGMFVEDELLLAGYGRRASGAARTRWRRRESN